jgi:hypothetical protein
VGLVGALPWLLLGRAPVERDFRSWVASRAGKRNADLLCAYSGVITFHHDPGSLSAAFVADRLRWVYLPPANDGARVGRDDVDPRRRDSADRRGDRRGGLLGVDVLLELVGDAAAYAANAELVRDGPRPAIRAVDELR